MVDGKMPGSCSLIHLLILSILAVVYANDEFHEELLVKPLASGHVYTHFQFTTKWDLGEEDPGASLHFELFPKSLGEVLDKFSVQELHLSQTQGVWRTEKWGYQVTSAPPGAQLWVWFKENTKNVDESWAQLVNVLSGMFCASLNFMDSKATVSPKLSFRPQGVASEKYSSKQHLLRYASLPREAPCTENLTPWKKLLPCSSKTGLASLFNAVKLYDSGYHSLGIDVRPVCADAECTRTAMELSQSLSVVIEPTINNLGKQDWSLKKLFGRALMTSCPLAASSKIYVDISSNKTLAYFFMLTPEPSLYTTLTRGGATKNYAVYDIPGALQNNSFFNPAAKYNIQHQQKPIKPPLLHTHRFQTGYGQEKGGIMTMLYNNHPIKSMNVIYMETIPWFIRVYYHTLRIENNKEKKTQTKTKLLQSHYVPGKDRTRPYHMELVLSLPPNSVSKISFQFERALLRWTEYPPDANHGFYVNSAVVSAIVNEGHHVMSPPPSSARISACFDDKSKDFFIRLYTESLLVSLPTPDFSMPYNVICLACTVVAIAFGSIHNLTTRRFIVKDPNKKTGLLSKIKGIFTRRKKAASPEPVKNAAEENSSPQENDKTESGGGKGGGGGDSKESKKDK